MAMGSAVVDQAGMLASGKTQGGWVIRLDTKTTWRLTGSDPTNLAHWTLIGLPIGTVIYQDSVTSSWRVARTEEAGTFLAE